MSAVNPYAPPSTPVADVNRSGVNYQPVRFFSSEGRVGRMRYVAQLLLVNLFFVVAAFAVGILTLVVLVPYLIFVMMKTIQRSHDMDYSGWTALLAFIPLVGLVWVFKGGTADSNRYGAPPPPNSRSATIVVTALIAVFLIGIVAAIAIPAYQQYTVRAKAAQVGK
jgi:uncharacterized membrane protein YhaH (DUF805 family)